MPRPRAPPAAWPRARERRSGVDRVTVTVNGRVHDAAPGETVESLLDRLGLAARYALVERNGEPVDRGHYDQVELEDGDTLVVARPVAGG